LLRVGPERANSGGASDPLDCREFNLPVSASESNFQRLAEENGELKTEPENQGTLVLCPYFLEYQKFQLDAAY
jgi:hypothetical protein